MMSSVDKMHPIVEAAEEYKIHLFLNYYKDEIVKDAFLANQYLQIERNIRRFITTDGTYLFYKNKHISSDNVPTISLLDRLGELRSTRILKNLSISENVYEIRINTEFEKNRILIFPYFFRDNVLILTYGFTKKEGEIDLTNPLAIDSQNVRNQLCSGQQNTNIIGEEFSA